jgi:3-phosphoglycerate kinase
MQNIERAKAIFTKICEEAKNRKIKKTVRVVIGSKTKSLVKETKTGSILLLSNSDLENENGYRICKRRGI